MRVPARGLRAGGRLGWWPGRTVVETGNWEERDGGEGHVTGRDLARAYLQRAAGRARQVHGKLYSSAPPARTAATRELGSTLEAATQTVLGGPCAGLGCLRC